MQHDATYAILVDPLALMPFIFVTALWYGQGAMIITPISQMRKQRHKAIRISQGHMSQGRSQDAWQTIWATASVSNHEAAQPVGLRRRSLPQGVGIASCNLAERVPRFRAFSFPPTPPRGGFWVVSRVPVNVVITCVCPSPRAHMACFGADLHSHRSCTCEMFLDVARPTSKTVEAACVPPSAWRRSALRTPLANASIGSQSLRFANPNAFFKVAASGCL